MALSLLVGYSANRRGKGVGGGVYRGYMELGIGLVMAGCEGFFFWKSMSKAMRRKGPGVVPGVGEVPKVLVS